MCLSFVTITDTKPDTTNRTNKKRQQQQPSHPDFSWFDLITGSLFVLVVPGSILAEFEWESRETESASLVLATELDEGVSGVLFGTSDSVGGR